MNWIVIIDGYAKKYLKRIPRKDANHIGEALRELEYKPYAGILKKSKVTKIFGAGALAHIEFSTKLTRVESLFTCPTLNAAPQARIKLK